MQEPLIVSAPGKIILFGDHSVVYKRKAIAASISLRTSLNFVPSNNGITLDFPDIGLHLQITDAELSSLSSLFAKDPVKDVDSTLSTQIDHLLVKHDLKDVPKTAATAFLYLLFRICPNSEDVKGTYSISSELPIGAGLGSSASVSVVIATALLILTRQIRRPESGQALDRASILKTINRWAYVGEQCMHGTPSGVDNTVATYGGAVVFQKEQEMQLIAVPTFSIKLTDTKVPRSTKTQVSKVAALHAAQTEIIEPIFDAMHAIAVKAETLFGDSSLEIADLGRLIELNQNLLRTIGVSHSSIEQVIDLHQGSWSKLLGAGGGGCVLTLLNTTTSHGQSNTIEGMVEYDVQLGGAGVGLESESGLCCY